MNFKVVFCMVLIAVFTVQGESATVKSTIKDDLVEALNAINGLLGAVANEANDYFVDRLKNYTQIQEWSVDIQDKVFTGLAAAGFDLFDDFLVFLISFDSSEQERKLMECVDDQRDSFLAAVSNASRQNGFCNNRLAGNLTVTFQEVSQDIVNFSGELGKDINSLNSCFLGDDVCIATFLTKVVGLVEKELVKPGTLVTGLKHVYGIYKIMFGQDVPACNQKFLYPLLLKDVETAVSNIVQCMA